MSKIITISLHTAIDKMLVVPNFEIGGVHSSIEASTYPAGKGVNVARTLDCLGYTTSIFGIVGRNDIELFNGIKNRYVHCHWTLDDFHTRCNLTIYDPQNEEETHIKDSDNPISENAIKDLQRQLHEDCEPGDIVIFSGSIPSSIPSDIYYRLGSMCRNLGAEILLDSSAEAFLEGLRCSPTLVKPNKEELEEILHLRLSSKEKICVAARDLAHQYEIPYVCVSMGKEGAILYDRQHDRMLWGVIDMEHKDCKSRHSVGSGDAMVAGLCTKIQEGASSEEILRMGIACGCSNLCSTVAGEVRAEDVAQLKECVQIQDLSIE